ncbi:hypothetical protein MNBD_PLANCTO02-685 [hydrothermal vent metagenome]|uniref:HTH arsR-type domain-containing protein n=1 Tax=hydrothermal vent metagenome TaxID=652676 RepID=A0A3B1E2N3_9ZZZZ
MGLTNQANLQEDFPGFPAPLRTELVNTFKLLADEKRLLLLFHLFQKKELHVSAMCDILEETQPVVSHHLALLREVGLLNVRKEGRHNYYSVCCDQMCGIMSNLFHFLCDKNKQEFQFHQFTMSKTSDAEGYQITQS